MVSLPVVRQDGLHRAFDSVYSSVYGRSAHGKFKHMNDDFKNGGAAGGVRPDKDAPEGGPRGKGRRRRKVSYLTLNKIDTVDYKEINILRRFLNDRGKILPSRQTGNTAGQQRMISEAIHRAREMALLPFVVTEMTADRREYGPRRERYNNRREEAPRTETPAES
jgi:small subunit ribosomal protein S18